MAVTVFVVEVVVVVVSAAAITANIAASYFLTLTTTTFVLVNIEPVTLASISDPSNNYNPPLFDVMSFTLVLIKFSLRHVLRNTIEHRIDTICVDTHQWLEHRVFANEPTQFSRMVKL